MLSCCIRSFMHQDPWGCTREISGRLSYTRRIIRRQSAGLRHARRHAVLILGFECWTSSTIPCGHTVSAFSCIRSRGASHGRYSGDCHIPRARRQSAGLRHARRHAVLILGFECWTSGATPCGHNVSTMSCIRSRGASHERYPGDCRTLDAHAVRALVYVMRVSMRS